jgi:predicted PurR-regulated permease PerM
MGTAESTARRACVAALVAGSVVAGALALWKLRLVVALVLAAVTIASAMRPGVDALARRRVPRPVGVLLHYAVLLGLVALVLWLVVPRLTAEVQTAIDTARTGHAHSNGIKARVLEAIQRRLRHLPSGGELVHPALTAGEEAVRILIAILFTLAAAAYWIFERDRAVDLVAGLLPLRKRQTLRDTWALVERKLGAFVRGELILIAFVGTAMSLLLALVGEPYWLLVGIATGFLEIIPIVGPMAAFALVVGAGLTDSWQTAAAAGAAMLGLRLFQDYVVSPRVLGGAVGLSPLLAMVSVTAVGILLGGFYVLLSMPLTSVVVTVVDVTVRGVEPGFTTDPATPAAGSRGSSRSRTRRRSSR